MVADYRLEVFILAYIGIEIAHHDLYVTLWREHETCFQLFVEDIIVLLIHFVRWGHTPLDHNDFSELRVELD